MSFIIAYLTIGLVWTTYASYLQLRTGLVVTLKDRDFWLCGLTNCLLWPYSMVVAWVASKEP